MIWVRHNEVWRAGASIAIVRRKDTLLGKDDQWGKEPWRGAVIGAGKNYFYTAEEAKTWCEAVMRLEGLL